MATDRTSWFNKMLKTPVLNSWISDWWLHILSLWFFNIPEIDQSKQGTKPQNFEKDRMELIKLMFELADEKSKNHIGFHPHFGHCNYEELNRLNYLHIDYHLRQCGK